jgi:DHA2 family multidrug resistance protein
MTMTTQPERTINPWIVAITVMLATFMEVLDTSVVNVSLPNIAGSLSAGVDEATWALTSYLVANAIILPITGWLATIIGRKRLLVLSVAGFTLASLLCGLAPTLPALILFRVLQGASGGALQPLSQAVLLEAFEERDHGKAMAFWALGVVVAPILGPVIGGWLTDNYSWRWIFYINLPIGIASVVMTMMFIFDPPYLKRALGRVDYLGIGLLTIGIATLQIVLDKGQEVDWFASKMIATLAIVSITALIALVVRELRAAAPVVDLRVFASRSYSTGVLLITVIGFVLYGSTVLLPLMLQTLFGYPPLQAGIAMAPRSLGSFAMMPVAGLLVSKVDPRKLLTAGLVIASVGLLWMAAFNLQAGYWDMFWPQIFQGAAVALMFVPLTTITMSGIAPERMGNATSLFNLMRNIGGSVGIAMTTTVLARRQQAITAIVGQHVTAFDSPSRTLLRGLQAAFASSGADAHTALSRAEGVLFGLVQREAAMIATLRVFQLFGLMFLLAIPLVLLMKRPKPGSSPIAVH